MRILEQVVAILLIIALILLVNPFMVWMPGMVLTAALGVIVALFCVWAGFVLYEHARDEREDAHRTSAGRTAFLAGAAVLALALLVQGLAHHIDPWIPAALAVMIVAKLATRFYADKYR